MRIDTSAGSFDIAQGGGMPHTLSLVVRLGENAVAVRLDAYEALVLAAALTEAAKRLPPR